MKVFSKIASLVLGAAFVFVFASCNAGSDDDSLIAKYILFQEYQESLITHTVTFETNGGTEIKSQIVRHKGKAEKPEVPEKTATMEEEFTFENWYLSEDDGTTLSDTPFDFNTAITEDITLYAKWAVTIPLKDCSAINDMFAALCGSGDESTVTKFDRAAEKPESAENYLDAAGTEIPLWYDSEKTTLFYYAVPGKSMSLRSSDSENRLFCNMTKLVSIYTNDFDTRKLEDLVHLVYPDSYKKKLSTLRTQQTKLSLKELDLNKPKIECSEDKAR